MNDASFMAEITKATLTAHAEEDKTIRRVVFSFQCEFSVDVARWLGPFACSQREYMVELDLKNFAIDLAAYHCKLTLAGTGGNVEVQASGVSAVAKVRKPGEEGQSEVVTLTFDAFPEAKLLTFLAAHVKEHVACTFQASQLAIEEAV